ncbi:hypothetical protein U0070_008999, partial [Myodes glareolus]
VCLLVEVDGLAGLGQRCVGTEGGGSRAVGSQAAEAGSLACSWGCWRTRGWVETITIEEEHTGALTAFLLPFLFLPPRPQGGRYPGPWGEVCTPGGWRPGRRAGVGVAAVGGGRHGPLPRAPLLPPLAPRPSSSPSSPSSSWSPATAARGAAGGTGAAQPLSRAAGRAGPNATGHAGTAETARTGSHGKTGEEPAQRHRHHCHHHHHHHHHHWSSPIPPPRLIPHLISPRTANFVRSFPLHRVILGQKDRE